MPAQHVTTDVTHPTFLAELGAWVEPYNFAAPQTRPQRTVDGTALRALLTDVHVAGLATATASALPSPERWVELAIANRAAAHAWDTACLGASGRPAFELFAHHAEGAALHGDEGDNA
jgi:hypothetical protein